jgi:hypothetical protein
METEKSVTQAKEVVRDLFARYTKPHHRIHPDAALDNTNRLRALDGLCGKCSNLELTFGRKDGKKVVVVGCTKDHFPTALYEHTPLGGKAVCPDYQKRK